MRKFLFFIAAVFTIASAAWAGTGMAFLEIPVGARESALGGAGAALITGPTSATYNPAIVAFTPRGLALMHTNNFGDTKAEFVGFTVRHGALAVSPSYWGTRVSGIELRDQPTRDPISTFDALNSAVSAAVAWQFGNRFSVGVTGRYLYEKISDASSDGVAMDAGVFAPNVVPGLTLGLAAQHMGHMNTMVSESPKLPTTLRGGFAYEHTLAKYGVAMITADAQGVKDNSPLFKGGIEYRAPGYVALRAGYVSGLDAQDVSFGIGLYIKHVAFDYAFIPFRENLGEGHRLSLTLDI